MSVDPGEGWRLLVRGEVQQDGDEFFYDRDRKWHPVYFVGHVLRSKEIIRRRTEPVNSTGVEVTTSGPYVAIEVHRAALAEIERLKAELEAIKQPKPEPEPEWFDLTPFDQHTYRKCDEAFHPHDNKWRKRHMANAVGAFVFELKRIGYTQFRCLLKDAPPELVAKAHKPADDPDEWVTQDRVSERQGLDEYRFVDQCNNAKSEWKPCIVSTNTKHGMSLPKGFIELRCRRRDLPPMPEKKPKTETVTFHEYMVRCGVGNEDWQLKWRTSKPKTNNWIPTGRTETREVVR